MILTQLELEQEMIDGGRERARLNMARNEADGRANANRYASPLFRRFVGPLAERIQAARDSKAPGRRQAHMKLLDGLEPEAVAFIAVRHMVVTLLQDPSEDRGRYHAGQLGRRIQDEQVLRQFRQAEPERFWLLQQELDRRHSRDPRHRVILALKDMRSLDLEPINWGGGNRDQVGAFLLEEMRQDGLLEAWHQRVKKGKGYASVTRIRLSWEVLELLDGMREMIEETTPYFLPCVEKPLDWAGIHGGGYHTLPMQQRAPVAVLHGNPAGGDCTTLVRALNVLQSVKWQVNGDILDVARALAKTAETDELVTSRMQEPPAKPYWLTSGMKAADMTEAQQVEFKAWKRACAECHTQNKLKGQKFGRMKLAFHVADKLRHQPELYFVYFADSRGRFYPYTTGISPQGSDMQKALLRFAEGKPLNTQDAVDWFLINGANKFGVDKVSYEDRIKWVQDNHQMILDCAAHPLDNRGWLEADAPFQFLAWAKEYSEFANYGRAFVSHLPIGMDGSCNGLQNFSAMLRDEVGGVATNLVPSLKPNDIYLAVATVCYGKVQAAEDHPMRDLWLQHGVNRKVAKRSVMTLPYGSTKFSSRDFILNDYIRGEDVGFDKEIQAQASSWLNEHLWASIGEVVVKAREAMDWLQTCSGMILDKYDVIQWKTPTGFVVQQDYRKMAPQGTVRVLLFGGARWNISGATDKPDRVAHRNAIAPNFIHSMDASHMQLVSIRAAAEGINSLAMIHDDFGTHAADAARFARIIREVFLEMYQDTDWLYEFAARYMEAGVILPDPPEKGTLDLTQVLDSEYFFG